MTIGRIINIFSLCSTSNPHVGRLVILLTVKPFIEILFPCFPSRVFNKKKKASSFNSDGIGRSSPQQILLYTLIRLFNYLYCCCFGLQWTDIGDHGVRGAAVLSRVRKEYSLGTDHATILLQCTMEQTVQAMTKKASRVIRAKIVHVRLLCLFVCFF